MGYEYEFHVPEAARPAAAELLARELPPLLHAFGSEHGMLISAVPIAEGVLVCDHKVDPTVSGQIVLALINLLLKVSPEVRIIEP